MPVWTTWNGVPAGMAFHGDINYYDSCHSPIYIAQAMVMQLHPLYYKSNAFFCPPSPLQFAGRYMVWSW